MATKTKGSVIQQAATKAAELYLERDEERQMKQCIAIAASQFGLEWKAIANYLTGCGCRHIIQQRDADCESLLYHAARKIQENHWPCYNTGYEQFMGDPSYFGIDYDDAVALFEALREYIEFFELEPMKRWD